MPSQGHTLEQNSQLSEMTASTQRRKSFRGFTEKERSKQVRSLNGSAAIASNNRENSTRHHCVQCQRRRDRILHLETEFKQLRELLLNKQRVFFSNEQENQNQLNQQEISLVQESAKLRITIDTLMRFQVSSVLFSGGDLFLHLDTTAV